MIQANELHAKTEWQRIFLQSKVNGAPYEEQESGVTWPWPEDTYLQRRLNHLRTFPSSDTPQESKQASDQNGPRVVDCGGWSSVFWATGETQKNPICVEMPADHWSWCANPIERCPLPQGFSRRVRDIIGHFSRRASHQTR